jgi:hypothetical protein
MLESCTFKASPLLSGDGPTPGGILRVTQEIPGNGLPERLSMTRDMFRAEAKNVVDFMQNTMPQGLVDHIFAELAARKASLFHITIGD